MSRPPLTPQTWPVMYAEASAARKATTRATSSGRPMRRVGIVASNDAITFAGTAAVISVSISPGVTALTVSPMPSPDSLSVLASANAASRASVFVSANSPDFEAA